MLKKSAYCTPAVWLLSLIALPALCPVGGRHTGGDIQNQFKQTTIIIYHLITMKNGSGWCRLCAYGRKIWWLDQDLHARGFPIAYHHSFVEGERRHRPVNLIFSVNGSMSK